MIINYKDADGRIIELEVTEEVGNFYITDIETENRTERRETRRHTQLSQLTYEDKNYFDSGIDISREYAEFDAIKRTMDKLTVRERFLILSIFYDGRTYSDISKREGKYPSTIMREANKAAEKFRRLYKRSKT